MSRRERAQRQAQAKDPKAHDLTVTHPDYPTYADEGRVRDAAYFGFGLVGTAVLESMARKYDWKPVTPLQHDWCWLTKRTFDGCIAAVVGPRDGQPGAIYYSTPGGFRSSEITGERRNWTTDNGTAVFFVSLSVLTRRKPDAIFDGRPQDT